MGYFKRILNNCSTASKVLVTDEPVSFRVRMEAKIHVKFCKCCKNFEIQNQKLEKALKRFSAYMEEGAYYKSSEEFKDRIKKNLK